MENQEQLSEEQAIGFLDSGKWRDMSHRERAEFQLMQDRLCMPWTVFHEAIEESLERGVYTHEFGLNREGLKEELFGDKEPPTLKDILGMLPNDKPLMAVVV